MRASMSTKKRRWRSPSSTPNGCVPPMKRAGKRTVQIGHQGCSIGQIRDAFAFTKTGYVGKITNVHSHMYGPGQHGTGMWTRPIQPDKTAENIVWKLFQGESQPHD